MPKRYYDEDEDEDEEEFDEAEEEKEWISFTKQPDFLKIFGDKLPKDFNIPDLDKFIKNFMKQFKFPSDHSSSDGPVVWGFSMSVGPDKKPVIRQFGNVNPQKKKLLPEGTPEPLLDICEEDGELIVIAEIPGVRKSDISLNSTESHLKISVNSKNYKFFKDIQLPCKVEPEGAQARYKNGILEVKLKKRGNRHSHHNVNIRIE
jgi:HSP20 family protein